MVEELAVIFKRKITQDDYVEIFVPIKVVEGHYNTYDELFVDKLGNTYHHIAEQITEGNVFGMRKSITEMTGNNPNKTLKEIKNIMLQKAKNCLYMRNPEESFIIYKYDKNTSKRRKFEDKDTKELYQIYGDYDDQMTYSSKEQTTTDPEEKSNYNNSETNKINKLPIELVQEIRKTIKGQDEAIISIVTNIWMNLNCPNMKKKNMLIIGPSGVGKTAILTKLAKILDIPLTIFSVPGLSQAGYVGKSTDEILTQLVMECKKDIKKAERGIIVLDEIDKLASHEFESGSVSTTGVQNELLKMIEGDKRMVYLDHFGSSSFMIDTSNIIFIGIGAFSELYENKRETQPIGFSRIQEEKTKNESKINFDKLISYGLKRELIGRLPVVVELNKLNEDILKDIIMNSDESELKYFIETLSNLGITITNIEEIVSLIAKDAIEKGIGARGIVATVNKIFSKIFYEVANNPGKYSELTLGENILKDNADFKLTSNCMRKIKILKG